MAPMSVSAILAPPPMTAQSPPPPTSKTSPRRAPGAVASMAAATFLAVVPAARAAVFSKEDLASSLTKAVDAADQLVDAGGKVAGQSVSALKALNEAVKPALKSAGEEALKIASPVLSGASKQAQEALQGAGVDPSPVLSAAKAVADAAQQSTKVIDAAKPVALATVETLLSFGPSDYVVAAGTAFLAYLLLPPVWSLVSFSLRGYKGNLSPAQALDLVTSQNYVLIDVRSEKEKNKAGVPQLPSNAKNKLISVPMEDLPSKIKGMVRNAKQAEAEIAALKISFLKRINKGSNIIVMDSYCDSAKIVARTLNSVGFKNSWVMSGGFSGRTGWVQSRLGTDSYNVSVVEVVTPSRIIPAAADRLVPASPAPRSASLAPRSPRKLLPGNVDA